MVVVVVVVVVLVVVVVVVASNSSSKSGGHSCCRKTGCHLCTVNPVLSDHSKIIPKMGFQAQSLLKAAQKYCRMLQENTVVVVYQ